MRGLQRRFFPDAHPGRDALGNGALAGADKAFRFGMEIIAFQIDHADKPHPRAGGGDSFRQDKALLHGGDQRAVPQVLLHGAADAGDPCVRLVQPAFRQDHAECGGLIAHQTLHFLPVGGLRSELIAGHTGPCGQVRALPGQQQLTGIKTTIGNSHRNFPPCGKIRETKGSRDGFALPHHTEQQHQTLTVAPAGHRRQPV